MDDIRHNKRLFQAVQGMVLLMKKEKKIPLRMCVGCRNQKQKRDLIRVVRTPDGKIELDFTGRKPGRGAYICASAACLKKAVKSKILDKSLQRSIPEEVVVQFLEIMENVP